MAVTLGELATRLGLTLRGDPAARVEGVSTLAESRAGTVTFLAESRHRRLLAGTRAAAVILQERFAADCPVAALISPNPRAAYARIAALLHPEPQPAPGVHPSAVIDAGARIDAAAHVGPLAVIGAGASIAAGAVIGPHCVVAEGSSVGPGTRLVARVTLGRGVHVGARCILHPGAVIGADGFGFAPDDGGWLKVPQVGGVRLGDDVEIGANTTVDRGAIGDTVIEDGVKLDNQIQVGHNVRIGRHSAIAGCTGISGSTVIGERCQIGGACAIGGHLSIASDTIVTGFTMISHSITRPGVYSSGIPFEDARTWRRLVARFKRAGSGKGPTAAAEEPDLDSPGP